MFKPLRLAFSHSLRCNTGQNPAINLEGQQSCSTHSAGQAFQLPRGRRRTRLRTRRKGRRRRQPPGGSLKIESSSDFSSNNLIGTQNKNSGHFLVSQLCATKSQFPVTKRVEGAVLSSNGDTDTNCTITFRTKSAQQHFVIRFEELKLGCDDHLKMFDGDLDYGQPSIKDFSCRDSLASAAIMKTTGTFLTMRFSTDSKANLGDGFRLVVTAVFDVHPWDCPPDYSTCHNQLCISRSLYCDGVNHCLDNSDEASCSSISGVATSAGSMFAGELSLSSALGLLVVLVLIIFSCVIIFILGVYCRRESHYAQYQHHLQRAMGMPMQTSSSLMFTNQPQYHYFQPANLSPYITPQHQPLAALPRGYSTLPLNLARQQLQVQQQQQQQNLSKEMATPNEYLMMSNLAAPMQQQQPSLQNASLQVATGNAQTPTTIQTSLFLPANRKFQEFV